MKGILSIYKVPLNYLFSFAIAVVIFDFYFILMARLPGVVSEACTVGGTLTNGNLIFSAVISLISSVMIFAFIQLLKKNGMNKMSTIGGSSMSIGFVVGFFTVFCALCTIPVVSVFGLAFGLGFFTTYNLFFKVLSLVLMFLSLLMINKQLTVECERCTM